MKQYSIIFYWGLVISFLGSLPPGAVNMAAAQISFQQGKESAIIYSAGSMLAEIIVVRVALTGMKNIVNQKRLFIFLELLTVVMLIVFTLGCFIAAWSNTGFADIVPADNLPPFKTGVLLSLFNPMHIPFWLSWTSLLMSKKILTPGSKQFNCLISGIAVGTMAGFTTFIFAGDLLLQSFLEHQFTICLIAGVILFLITFLHIRKLFLSPVSVRYTKLRNEIAKSLQMVTLNNQ